MGALWSLSIPLKTSLHTAHSMLPADFVEACILLARNYAQAQSLDDEEDAALPSPLSESESLSLGGAAPSSAPSYSPDPHAVSQTEALSYYAGLPSEPTLLYRTGKEWSPPRGPEAQRRRKELREVFEHPIAKVWNQDLGWRVVEVMDAHRILFTTIDVVRFKMVDVDEELSDEEDADEENEEAEVKKPVVGPVTIWIGVFSGSTSATVAHDAAQAVLALLRDYQITDVDAGPQLLRPVDDLDPLVDVIGPLTPTLGLGISTTTRPNAQGTMALYLAEGRNSDKLLCLTCRHVLIGPKEANVDFVRRPGGGPSDVILLGKKAFNTLLDTIQVRIGRHAISADRWRTQIEGFEKREEGTDADDVEKARKYRVKTQALLRKAEEAMEALGAFFSQVNNDWKKRGNRVLDPVLRSPAIRLGVGERCFTEDWGIFRVDRAKLGDGFQGNKIDLGTKLRPDEFTLKCFPRGDANWRFKYPVDRLLPLKGTITDELMRHPDMWGLQGESCLLVVKCGNATGSTLGRANGVFSIVREYFQLDMSVSRTSMEWGIISYDSKSGPFSEPGDSGSIIADIRGRVGGMLTGSSGKSTASDITYATPFWWLLQQIRANGFPDAHLDVLN
ncbi:hypothetical protein V8D89_014847 [Ganoderma adspersum]